MLERTCSQDTNNAPITIANGFRAACAPSRQIISRLWASRLGQRCGSRSLSRHSPDTGDFAFSLRQDKVLERRMDVT